MPVTVAIIGILLAASFGYSLNPTAHAASIDLERRLIVNGLVEQPLNITLADLFAMPQTTIYAALVCVGPPAALVVEGMWTGVKLSFLMQEAGVLNGVLKVAFYAADNYTTDLMFDTSQRDDVILAYEINGVPLNETLRLVVPNQSGYKWISDVIRIELVDYNFLGYWESGGLPDDAPISGYGIYPILKPVPQPKINPPNSSNPLPPQTQSPPQTASPNTSTPVQQTSPPAEIEQGTLLPLDLHAVIVATVVIAIIVAVAVAFVIRKRRRGFT